MFENLYNCLAQQYHQYAPGGTSAHIPTTSEGISGTSIGHVINNAGEFTVNVNVAQFRPDDLKVSLEQDRLIIEGHQKQQQDQHGTIERHFIRRCTLPGDVDNSTLTSRLSGTDFLYFIWRN
ncbi:unnamed protein product [Gongylonema pulchrum]|uniref:SHSP domain-containing protein n=1 Tax=Gongylonema pulchrum TaxID=637853 RepID=A0A183D296_9BILA|nr:unnamed protein product [Gongylonema pulchrum]